MKKKIFNAKPLLDAKIDASVNFTAGGDILVIPCPWEQDKEVTVKGKRVRYRAGVEVDADGRTRVKHYLDGMNGPKHDTLFETPHGAVKMTRPMFPPSDNGRRRISEEFVYVTFKFPKKYGAGLIRALYREEADEIAAYLTTRKEETVWA
ncbi:MAG: hypothetical protein J1E58_10745 [Prevotella sp.]|nr:hypothetical protein [Prevotella sp.]